MESDLAPFTVYYICNDKTFLEKHLKRYGKTTDIQRKSAPDQTIPKILFLKEKSAQKFYEDMKKEEYHEKIFVSREPIITKIGLGPLGYWSNSDYKPQIEFIKNDLFDKLEKEIAEQESENSQKPDKISHRRVEPSTKKGVYFAMCIASLLLLALAMIYKIL